MLYVEWCRGSRSSLFDLRNYIGSGGRCGGVALVWDCELLGFGIAFWGVYAGLWIGRSSVSSVGCSSSERVGFDGSHLIHMIVRLVLLTYAICFDGICPVILASGSLGDFIRILNVYSSLEYESSIGSDKLLRSLVRLQSFAKYSFLRP